MNNKQEDAKKIIIKSKNTFLHSLPIQVNRTDYKLLNILKCWKQSMLSEYK